MLDFISIFLNNWNDIATILSLGTSLLVALLKYKEYQDQKADIIISDVRNVGFGEQTIGIQESFVGTLVRFELEIENKGRDSAAIIDATLDVEDYGRGIGCMNKQPKNTWIFERIELGGKDKKVELFRATVKDAKFGDENIYGTVNLDTSAGKVSKEFQIKEFE